MFYANPGPALLDSAGRLSAGDVVRHAASDAEGLWRAGGGDGAGDPQADGRVGPACTRNPLALSLRQAHDEAGAGDLAGGIPLVLRPDRAFQRLDDLPADRQAQAGMLAEPLAMRPVRCRTRSNTCSSRASGMPGPWSSTPISTIDPASAARRVIVPPGGLKLCALPIRLRNTCTRRSSTAWTSSGASGRLHHQPGLGRVAGRRVDFGQQVQDAADIHRARRGPAQFGVDPAGVADVADQPVQPHHVLGDESRQQPLAGRPGSSMRLSVSMALRIELSGFLISCATSAANCSVASIRDHSASLLSCRAAANSPISSLRRSSRGGTGGRRGHAPPACHAPPRSSSRMGRAMVSDRYQDSITVSTRAITNSPRMEERIAPRAVSRPPAHRGSATRCRPCGGCAARARPP